jgi:hypothetical protein
MKKYLTFITLLITLFSCKSSHIPKESLKTYTVSISQEGLIDCFPPQWDSIKNRWTFCELSAAVVYKNELLTASDKAIPEHSSVLKLEMNDATVDVTQSPNYLDEEILKKATKFEDFSISSDQKYIFLTTGFDRLKNDGWDDYNCLISWPVGQAQKAQLLAKSERNGVQSSINLRSKIKAALADNNNPKGPEYFKVEGLAATPNQELIFGIREMGNRYDDFQYKIVLLSIKYKVGQSGGIELKGEMKPIYEFNPYLSSFPELELPIALSSIEYDPYNKHFYLTTSFEHNEKLGAYLWILDQQALETSSPPILLKTPKGEVFEMQHKAEAVSVINKNKILIIHDDDRALIGGRAAHQAAFQILNIN